LWKEATAMEFEDLSNKIIGLAIEVHKNLGPGLLENTYKECLAYELSNAGLKYEKEKPVSVNYKNTVIPVGYRIDILVENKILIELKSVEKIHPVFEAQILTYMRLSNIKVGLLLNFYEKRLSDGLKRYVV